VAGKRSNSREVLSLRRAVPKLNQEACSGKTRFLSSLSAHLPGYQGGVFLCEELVPDAVKRKEVIAWTQTIVRNPTHI
jgi:hypothetical protein